MGCGASKSTKVAERGAKSKTGMDAAEPAASAANDPPAAISADDDAAAASKNDPNAVTPMTPAKGVDDTIECVSVDENNTPVPAPRNSHRDNSNDDDTSNVARQPKDLAAKLPLSPKASAAAIRPQRAALEPLRPIGSPANVQQPRRILAPIGSIGGSGGDALPPAKKPLDGTATPQQQPHRDANNNNSNKQQPLATAATAASPSATPSRSSLSSLPPINGAPSKLAPLVPISNPAQSSSGNNGGGGGGGYLKKKPAHDQHHNTAPLQSADDSFGVAEGSEFGLGGGARIAVFD
jgi:hypothetical protein